jgi:hypothetical protein
MDLIVSRTIELVNELALWKTDFQNHHVINYCHIVSFKLQCLQYKNHLLFEMHKLHSIRNMLFDATKVNTRNLE